MVGVHVAQTYRVRMILYVNRELNEEDLISQAAAAELLGTTVQGVHSAVERGRFTLIEDPRAHQHQRRHLLLRAEVIKYKHRRRAASRHT